MHLLQGSPGLLRRAYRRAWQRAASDRHLDRLVEKSAVAANAVSTGALAVVHFVLLRFKRVS